MELKVWWLGYSVRLGRTKRCRRKKSDLFKRIGRAKGETFHRDLLGKKRVRMSVRIGIE